MLSSVVVTDELEEGEDLLVIPESDTSTCPQIVAPASKLRPERSTVKTVLQVAPPISPFGIALCCVYMPKKPNLGEPQKPPGHRLGGGHQKPPHILVSLQNKSKL